MSSVNKVILVGHLGNNPELRYTPNGKPVCTLSLATNRSYLDKENNRHEQTNWHKVVAWGRQGEVCNEHLIKGQQIYVEGRIENRSYTDKEGIQRWKSEVVSNSVIFLGKKDCSGGSFSESGSRGGESGVESPPMEELPF